MEYSTQSKSSNSSHEIDIPLIQQFWNLLFLFFSVCVSRSSLAAVNTWRAPRAQDVSASAISFDGTGYLFAEQMADVEDFDADIRILDITTRPNEERDGLVLYAYDRDVRYWNALSVDLQV